MADVDGGSLSFESILDNSQLEAAIDETMRRVQGLSDGFVSSGQVLDDTMSQMAQAIQSQVAYVQGLENSVSSLDAQMANMQPGDALNAIAEQARNAHATLDAERQGLQELTQEFQRLQQVNDQTASSLDKVSACLGALGAMCEAHEQSISRLEGEYDTLGKQMEDALTNGRKAEYEALKQTQQSVSGEIATRKKLLDEIREQSNALEQMAEKERKAAETTNATAQAHVSLRTRIKELKEEMARLRMEGIDENSEAYKRLVNELGNLQDIQGDIQAQGSIMSNDENQFAGVMSGLQGVTGGFTAASTAMSMFAGENENLQAAMLKVQQLMTITMGLQQVSQALNKDSAFQLVTMTNLRNWWNNLLAVGRGEQIADNAAMAESTAVTGANTTALGANTVAQQANNQARGAGVTATNAATAAAGANTTAVNANTAAVGANAAAARAGTTANIGLAGGFRMIGAAIKSIPVFGWIIAGITALIGLYSHFKNKAEEAKKAQLELSKAINESVYKPLASIEQLSLKYTELGDNLEAKKKFVIENQKAFNELGVKVADVVDAENLLIANKEAFVEAQTAKAKAIAFSQMATEEYKEYLDKLAERDQENPNKIKLGLSGWYSPWQEANEEAKGLLAESQKYFDMARQAESEGWEAMTNAGIAATETYADGTVGAIEQAIAVKRAALQHLTNNEDYKKALQEIDELQKQVDAITGKTSTTGGSGSTKKDPFLEKLSKYKSEYQRFLKWVNSGDAVLQQAAQTEFAGLLAEGATYIDWLQKQRDELLEISNRTKAQDEQLRQINNAIADETKTTVIEAFNQELNAQLSNANSVIEMLNIIKKKREELANDGTDVDKGKADALNDAEKKAKEQAAGQIKDLLNEYAGYVAKKKQLEEDFNRDMALLAKARVEAQTESDREAVDAAMANRRIKYNKDSRGSGDEDYDALKEQYRGYQQQINAIREDFEEKRRVATLHNDQLLLAQLAEEESRQLSEVQKKMLTESVDWQKLFGNLDELSSDTIKDLIAKIEAQKIQFSAEFSPQDLQAINEQLEKARETIESRNPFTAMGNAFNKLRETIRTNKLLDSNDAFVQEMESIEQQYKEYQAWISSGNEALAQGANQNFADLLSKGGSYLDYLKRKKEELQGKVNMGVDVGNSIQIIDALIQRAETGKTAADNMRDALQDAFSSLSGTLGMVSSTFNSVVDGIKNAGISMDEETEGILNDVGGVMEGATQAMAGYATMNPMQMISGSITMLSSAISLFNSGDRKAEKSIKKHKEQINKLKSAYEQLEWQIDKALGTEVYTNQKAAIKNLQQQQVELYGMISDERSKKKTDNSKIQDYQDQIAELTRQIEDLYDEISEDILQTNASDFADTLGDALVEAFSEGEDAAKAFEDTVNEVLKNAVVNQLKKTFLEKQLQTALDSLEKSMGYWSGDDFIFDGLTDSEIASFKAKVQSAANNFSQALEIYKDLFSDIMGDDEDEDSLTGAVKGVTEETANIIAGQMNAIRINQIEAAEILRQQLQALNTIANNTSYNRLLQNIYTTLQSMHGESQSSDADLRSQGLS